MEPKGSLQSSKEPANNRAVPFFQMTDPSVTVICDEKGWNKINFKELFIGLCNLRKTIWQ